MRRRGGVARPVARQRFVLGRSPNSAVAQSVGQGDPIEVSVADAAGVRLK
jgi:hypothetical protein